MKIIIKIAKAELRTLFFSPIAWLVVCLFYFSLAMAFGKSMIGYSTIQEAMLELESNWLGFSQGLSVETASNIAFFVEKYIFLFIPLLTMGIVSREMSNGTIKLLHSSPVTTREIITGKYLGIMLFNILLILIVAIFLFASCLAIEQPEYSWLLISVLLGYFLLINTYAAIGLFISCLTSYQIVAAVITFAVFYLLSVISGFWQQYDLIRDITYYLALPQKTANLMRGLITSKDVIYFILVIVLFLGYTMIRLRNTQQPRSRMVNVLHYATLTVIIITMGYFSSRPGYIAYLDVTNRQTNTLHPAVLETVREMDGSPLTVTLYSNLLGGKNITIHGMPRLRNQYVWNVWEPFVRFYPNIKLRYEYYYDLREGDSGYYKKYPGKTLEEIVAIEAEMLDVSPSMFKTPTEIRKMIDLEPESKRLVMQLEYKGKKEFLRTYENPRNPWPFPNHFAAAFKRLTRKEDVRLAFVTGHYERNPLIPANREYNWHTGQKLNTRALINEGVDCDTISLEHRDIPSNLNLLVVADPKTAYLPEEQNKIIRYLKNGGNAIFHTDTKKQQMLAPILQTIGVYPDEGMIVRPDKHESPHLFETMLNKAGNYLAKEEAMEKFQRYGVATAKVKTEGAVNLSYKEIDGFTIEPIIAQPDNDNIWIEKGSMVMDSATPVYSAAEGDLKKSEYVIGLKLSRKIGNKEQRIIVAGDADFMSAYRRREPGIGVGAYSWALYNQYPIYDNFPLAEDRHLTITHKEAKLLNISLTYIGSGILLSLAIILLVRRNRK